MGRVQREILNRLLLNLCTLIVGAKVSQEDQMSAIITVDYFLYNPLVKQEPDFFHLIDYKHTPTHDHVADKRWVAMLTHLLNSSYDLLQCEIDRLSMIEELDLSKEHIPTKDQLESAYVRGLAKLGEVELSNYNEVRSAIMRELFDITPDNLSHPES